MPSHLTRQICRRIIANEPIFCRGCLRRQGYSSIAPLQHGRRVQIARNNAFPAVRRYQQRRTLFGLNMFRQKAPRDTREANYEPGIERMMEFAKMKRLQARLPPVEEVAHALKLYIKKMSPKARAKFPMEDTQTQLVLQSLRYCLETQKTLDHEPLVTTHDLYKLARVARRKPRQLSQAHLDLAKLLYDELYVAQVDRAKCVKQGTLLYLSSLAWSGRSAEARELLLNEYYKKTAEAAEALDNEDQGGDNTSAGGSDGEIQGTADGWNQILAGFSREANEAELLRTLAIMKEQGVYHTIGTKKELLDFFMAKQDPVAVKEQWSECQELYSSSTQERGRTPIVYQGIVSRVLTWCLSSGNLALGHEVVKDVMSSNPSKPIWDAVLVWGAGTKKSVDEIGRMLDVMQNSNETIADESEWRIPDTATINALVRYAISQNDPYMAERFIALGRDRGIQPDAETFVLQIEYRLSVNDVDGALVAYKHLQAQYLSTNSDVQAVNRLIVALCTSQRHDFETIMSVVADLSDREANFEAMTVSTLSVLHLNRDEIHDVIDLLNTHSFGYSSAERATIRQSLVDYCLDLRTTTTRAWDTYTILRSIFDEMAREQRTEIMLNFFKHERADMAVNVFNHMRHHSRTDTMPNDETYVSAFLGCAKLGDLESLEVVHNQLKLDYNVNQTTYCRNALIIAYSVCDKPRAALDFWDDIVASREGPTYNSIHIALRACEKSAFGDLKAQEIWARLRKNKVELDHSMWASYIAALAGNGDNELARTILEEAEQSGEVEVDAFLLGSLLDAAAGQLKQADIEMWAEEKYPEVWRVLKEEIGWTVDEARMRKANIDRTVTP